MGLFSSKKKVRVASTTVTLLAEAPETIKDSALASIRNGTSINEDMHKTIINSIAIKAKQFKTRCKDDFRYGLPSGEKNSVQARLAAIRAVIQRDVKHKVFIRRCMLDYLDEDAYGEDWLSKEFGLKNDGKELVLINPPIPNTEMFYDDTRYVSSTELEYSLRYLKEGKLAYYKRKITVDEMVKDKHIYHVRYSLMDSTGKIAPELKYWFYVIGSGEETLDFRANKDTSSVYYPFIPFRLNDVNLMAKDESYKKELKKLLAPLEIKAEKLNETIEKNPNIKGVDHIYMYFGVPLKSTKPKSLNYLFEYFKYYWEQQTFGTGNFQSWQEKEVDITESPPSTQINIANGELDFTISFYIKNFERKQGKVGKEIGDVTREVKKARSVVGIFLPDARDTLILKKQVGINTYEEVQITSLSFWNRIYKNKGEGSTLHKVEEEKDESFFIPLHEEVLKRIPYQKRIPVYYDSLRLIMQSYEEYKLKWYQTGIFKLAVIIIIIVVAVFYPPFAATLASYLASAAAIVGSTSLIVGALVLLAISQAVTFVIAYIIQFLPPEVAMVIMIIIVAYSVATGNFETLGLVDSVGQGAQMSMDRTLEKLVAKHGDWIELAKELESELDKIEKDLEGNLNPNSIAMLVRSIRNQRVDEDADAFLHRMLDPIPTITTMEAIYNYYEVMLNLPLTNQTLGELEK